MRFEEALLGAIQQMQYKRHETLQMHYGSTRVTDQTSSGTHLPVAALRDRRRVVFLQVKIHKSETRLIHILSRAAGFLQCMCTRCSATPFVINLVFDSPDFISIVNKKGETQSGRDARGTFTLRGNNGLPVLRYAVSRHAQ